MLFDFPKRFILLFFLPLFALNMEAQAPTTLTVSARKKEKTEVISLDRITGLRAGKSRISGKVVAVTDSSFTILPFFIHPKPTTNDSILSLNFSQVNMIYYCRHTKMRNCPQRAYTPIGMPFSKLVIIGGIGTAGFFLNGAPLIGGAFALVTAGLALEWRHLVKQNSFDLVKDWKISPAAH